MPSHRWTDFSPPFDFAMHRKLTNELLEVLVDTGGVPKYA